MVFWDLIPQWQYIWTLWDPKPEVSTRRTKPCPHQTLGVQVPNNHIGYGLYY